MKITDLYESEFLTDKDEIIEWMDNSFRKFYPNKLIIESAELGYDGGLSLNRNIKIIKVQFKSVTDYFDCGNTKITSLEGCPKIVGNYFSCSDTKITSLKGCPQTVEGDFGCDNTNITSLKFFPISINGEIYCRGIKITDPKEYRYALYCEMGGTFESRNEKIDEIINVYGGSSNRKYWPRAINLLSKVQL